jgi:uncharacterized linocin/CFP29 family protein
MTSPNHLLRDKAPIPVRAWRTIDAEAKDRLTPLLAGRKLADWVGPGGWRHDALSLGRTDALDAAPAGLDAGDVMLRRRRVLPLAEYRVPFTVDRSEIDDIQRGSRDPDLDDLARAAQVAAELENRAVLHGWEAAGIDGIAESSPYPVTALGDECSAYPSIVAVAVDRLRQNGIEGPYAFAIGPDRYTDIVATAEHGGYLLMEHINRILGAESHGIVRSPGLDGALVVSQRGSDFLLDVGQDISIGYRDHDAEVVHLYLEESFTFLVAEPDAAVTLR